MAAGAALGVAALGLEHPDLRPLRLAHQGGDDQGALDHRLAERHRIAADCQDALELHRSALLGVRGFQGRRAQQLDVEDVAGLDAVLLSTTLDHCEHRHALQGSHPRAGDGRTYHGTKDPSTRRPSWVTRFALPLQVAAKSWRPGGLPGGVAHRATLPPGNGLLCSRSLRVYYGARSFRGRAHGSTRWCSAHSGPPPLSAPSRT